MRAVALLLILAAPAAAGLAVDLEVAREAVTTLPAKAPAIVVARVPFHLDVEALVYAKMLVAPWNPVNPGAPNGTWAIQFTLADADGAPLARDATGAAVTATHGPYRDSTATPPVRLNASVTYTLLAEITVPAAATVPGAEYRIPMAIAVRDAQGPGATSGGTLDASRGFTQVIRVPGGPAPAAPASTPPSPVDWMAVLLPAALTVVVLSAPLAAVAAWVAARRATEALEELRALREERPPGP